MEEKVFGEQPGGSVALVQVISGAEIVIIINNPNSSGDIKVQ